MAIPTMAILPLIPLTGVAALLVSPRATVPYHVPPPPPLPPPPPNHPYHPYYPCRPHHHVFLSQSRGAVLGDLGLSKALAPTLTLTSTLTLTPTLNPNPNPKP